MQRGRGRALFSKNEVTRAARAAQAAGLPVRAIEIDKDGRMRVVIGEPTAAAPTAGGNPWDEVLNDKPEA